MRQAESHDRRRKNRSLPVVIAAIRLRTAGTQTEFARKLKVTQPTITRYESGELTPGHYPLLVLFSLAQGHEKRVIAEALQEVLGLAKPPTEEVIRDGLDIAEKAFSELVKMAARTPLSTRAHRFVTEALQVATVALTAPEEYPSEAVIEILSLWREHRDDPETMQLFQHFLGYLEVTRAMKGKPRAR